MERRKERGYFTNIIQELLIEECEFRVCSQQRLGGTRPIKADDPFLIFYFLFFNLVIVSVFSRFTFFCIFLLAFSSWSSESFDMAVMLTYFSFPHILPTVGDLFIKHSIKNTFHCQKKTFEKSIGEVTHHTEKMSWMKFTSNVVGWKCGRKSLTYVKLHSTRFFSSFFIFQKLWVNSMHPTTSEIYNVGRNVVCIAQALNECRRWENISKTQVLEE